MVNVNQTKKQFCWFIFLANCISKVFSLRLVLVMTTALFGITVQIHCAMFNRLLKEEESR